jgi:hypothetical protein
MDPPPLISQVAIIRSLESFARPVRDAGEAIDRAEQTLAICGHATEDSPLFEELDRAEGHRVTTGVALSGWLGNMVRAEWLGDPEPGRCGDIARHRAEFYAARDHLDHFVPQMEERTATGLWLGLFPVCATTTHPATVESGDYGPVLRIRFRSPYDVEFERYSGDFIDGGMSYRMTIRLDGRVIARPSIYEPLRTAGLVLDEADIDAAQRAGTRPCS